MAELQKDIISLNNSLLAIDGNVLSVTPPPPDYVQIGDQVWKTKNLAIDDGLGGIYTQTVDYGQGPVVEYYYEWAAAVRVAATVPGWHLPTINEWWTLRSTAGDHDYDHDFPLAGKRLKATYGWASGKGTDNYGFSVLPAGEEYLGIFQELLTHAYFWTASEIQPTRSYFVEFNSGSKMYTSYNDKTVAYTVRLIKD